MDWLDIAGRYGLPFALVALALHAFLTESVVPAGRLKQAEQDRLDVIQKLSDDHGKILEALKATNIEALRALREADDMVLTEVRANLADVRADRDFYKELAFTQSKALTRATSAAERAVQAIPSARKSE